MKRLENKANTLTFQKTINIRGTLLDFGEPCVMGVINITPDSFYTGSRLMTNKDIVARAGQMLEEGATFLDIGGYSSRPGAKDVNVSEEIDRVQPAVQGVIQAFPDALISIDTFRSEVAAAALDAGAALVNDISGGDLDAQILDVVASHGVPYVLMHMRGTPQEMSNFTDYNDLITDIIHELSVKIERATRAGIHDIIVDPGFGFAKTVDQNFQLLGELKNLEVLEKPLLVGLSRKSMIYKSLNIKPEEALNGTTVLNTVALLGGASILRVHDVKQAVEAVKLIKLLTV